MRVALLDVNVLVALFDSDHIHHDAAHDWFAANRAGGWATCPLTENGLVRILSNATYSGVHETTEAIRERLDAFCGTGNHAFWPDAVSLRDQRFRLGRVTFPQVTDVYLLGLAAERGGQLATFDRRIPLHSVSNADRDSLVVIPA
ncbi:MAG TPA: VapC toxin family PIN domain ribonuclease [Actinobacteria bacterium]|nr:VapC toxin family PIN domain ribonuclease [Actinomycetota bacterium]